MREIHNAPAPRFAGRQPGQPARPDVRMATAGAVDIDANGRPVER